MCVQLYSFLGPYHALSNLMLLFRHSVSQKTSRMKQIGHVSNKPCNSIPHCHKLAQKVQGREKKRWLGMQKDRAHSN